MTKIRCYMMRGEYIKARTLIGKLRFYAEKCDRTYILVETEMLSAAIGYRTGSKAFENDMKNCLRLAGRYGLTRIISDEGEAIVGIIESLAKDAQFAEEVGKRYLDRVLADTKRIAKQYPFYLRGEVTEVRNFSGNALEVMRLQAKGLSVAEIASALVISVDTVKYHIKQNYRKLGVSGKAGAVLTAKKLGII